MRLRPRQTFLRGALGLLAALLPGLIAPALAQVHAGEGGDPAPTCASCHAPFADPQPHSGMGRALLLPGANPTLNQHPGLSFTRGGYTYSVKTQNGASNYSVTDGQRTLTVPILWSFGANNQTWMLALNGKMYESLVSYYPIVNGLAITTGDDKLQPATLEQALGRELTTMDVKTCFGCHATNTLASVPAGTQTGLRTTAAPSDAHAVAAPLAASAVTAAQEAVAGSAATLGGISLTPAVLATGSIPGMPDLKTLQAGVTCEHCHLGAAAHLLDASNGHFESAPRSLGKLTSEDMSNFCGKCHRTWDMVVRSRWRGEMNVRFQPYRLANSACYNGADARIGCTACHNPHEDVVRDAAFYDKKCLACHAVDPHAGEPRAGAGARAGEAPRVVDAALLKPGALQSAEGTRPPKACPVAKNNCTSCHMPKVVLPGSSGHLTFTDHQIRVVKAGDAYPN